MLFKEARGGVCRGRLATRNMKQRSLKTDQYDCGWNRDDGGVAVELHSDNSLPCMRRDREVWGELHGP